MTAVARARASAVVSVSLVLLFTAARPPIVKSQAPTSGSVSVWLTTVDRANLLAPRPSLAFAPDSGDNPVTIDVDPSTTYQEMDGFGASFTDSSAWLVYNRLPADARRQLMLQLFDRTQGIGLSYLRQPMGASDFALAHYSYDDVPAGQTDPGLARFSIDHDREYIVPVLLEALSINPSLRIMATPWSAPGWMKSSGSLIGGSLNPGAEADYANYFVRFIQAYESAGIPIDRITPQNEPHYTPGDYPGMWMDASQQAAFIGHHLGPALAAAGLPTRIDAWDHNWDDTTYAPAVFADPVASPYVAGSAWHCYAGAPAAMTTVHDRYPAKEVLFTECSGGEWQRTFRSGFAWDMDTLIIGGPRNWARTVIKWNVALDTNNGPHTGGCATCAGLVTIDQATGGVTFNYDYYSLGHISKFVVPGARRVASNTFGSSSIEDVAFLNPDGTRVLIVFNADSNSTRTFKVREGGQAFSYTLRPGAAATFTWRDTGASGVAPAVALTSPPDGSAYAAPASITVGATASSPAGIARVEFRAGSTLIGTTTSSPYSVAWNNVNVGSYSVTATAIGNDGGRATSSPSIVTVVDETTNLALHRPAVASSSESGSYPAQNAVDGDMSTRWSSAFADPQWLQVDLGSRYTLSKIVMDWELSFAVSYELQVSDDAVNWVTFYATNSGGGGTETVQPAAAVTGRYVRIVGTQRTYVYDQQWGYSLWEFRAYGVPAGSPPPSATPTVTLTSPSDGARFTAPATIQLAASASEPGGTITRVEFFTGPTRLATVSAEPYTFTWNAVPAGTYTLTARATDATGRSATSAPVRVTVKRKR